MSRMYVSPSKSQNKAVIIIIFMTSPITDQSLRLCLSLSDSNINSPHWSEETTCWWKMFQLWFPSFCNEGYDCAYIYTLCLQMKTVSVALVLCLNVGVDPPDVVKTSPCARLECWIGEKRIKCQMKLMMWTLKLRSFIDIQTVLAALWCYLLLTVKRNRILLLCITLD